MSGLAAGGWRARLDRLQGPLTLVAFLGGFAFDALTLRRPDQPLDLALLGLYLLLATGVVVLEQRLRLGRPVPLAVRARAGWVHAAAQFLLGALLSATVVLYARSGGLDRTLGFVAALVGLMVLVERAGARLQAEVPRVLLLGISAFCYGLLVVPVLAGRLPSRLALILGCLSAAGALGAVVTAAVHADGTPGRLLGRVGRFLTAWVLLAGVFVGMERARVLPPVPLAVFEAAVVRDVSVRGGAYTLTYADPPWWAPLREDERTVAWRPGQPVWVFTAIFAPTGLTTGITHVWERRLDGAWAETDRIPYAMTGGRDGGYRGYTRKRRLAPGDWRVRVETADGRELVRVPFTLVQAEEGAVPELIQRGVE